MKKFTKMLALVLAMALVFGMTVSAADSKTTGSVTIKGDNLEAVESLENFNTAETTAAETKAEAAVSKVNELLNAAYASVDYVGGFNLTVTEGVTIPKLTIEVSGIVAGKNYAVIHFDDNYNILQVLKATDVGNGVLTISGVVGGSPFAVVELVPPVPTSDDRDDDDSSDAAPAAPGAAPVSPKTGETIPVAGILAVICLAGAAVCAKKVRYNK